MAEAGHNSALNGVEIEQLRGYVQEIIALEEEKRETADQIKGIYTVAKDKGFSKKALRHIVKLKMMDAVERIDQAALEDTIDNYKLALGLLVGTPLGDAAVEREFGPAAGDVSDPPFKPAA